MYFRRRSGLSLLEAGAPWNAGALVDRLVVHADDGLGAVAPEMAGGDVLAFLVGKRLLRRGADIHFFRPQMFAESRVHGVNLSI